MTKPKKPKMPRVSFTWTVEGREQKACCKLCIAQMWAHSKSELYVWTSKHKGACPKVREWREEMRALGLYA